MTMRMNLLVTVLFLSISAHTAVASDYEIRLHRPMRVGEKFHILSTGSNAEKTVITVGGNLVRDDRENFEASFESVVKVLATDRNGKPTKESITVLRCEKTEAFDWKSLLPKGTVVIASLKEKDEVFEIDDKPVSREVHDLLAFFVTLSKGEATDDEIFGTRQRKQVGESWDINAELAARDLDDLHLGVRKENVAGKTTLEKVFKAGGTDCLLVSAEVTVNKFAPPLPPGLSMESSLLRASISAKFPVDTTAQPHEGTMGVSVTFAARGKPEPNAPEVVIDGSFERHITEKVEPVRE
jgi:acyl-CoA hydrolase